jgi:hypothetical protein
MSFIFILGIEITYKLDEKINGFMQLHPTGSSTFRLLLVIQFTILLVFMY